MDRRAPRNPDPVKRSLTFPRSHREAIAALDFFTVPTLTFFGVLYCSFVIGHDRRSCILMRHEIPMLFGLYSNCEKHGPTHTDSCYSIETQSLEPMWFRQ